MAKKKIYDDLVTQNLDKYQQYLSWARWYPDLYLEFFRDPNNTSGSIELDIDQRMFMRCDIRFRGMSGYFSRGYSKTYTEVLTDELTLSLYPNISVALTAQTKEAAVKLMKQKHTEIIRHFPLLENEIEYARFNKADAEIKFKNGSFYRALANNQNSKGERANRLRAEESALVDQDTFLDAIKPIVEVPRMLTGKARMANPEEMNGQIHFFSTTSWRNSDEFNRCMEMLNNMADCKGGWVMGAAWFLPCWYGRGSPKSEILEKAKSYTPVQFAQNYMSKFTGSSAGALVSMNKLMKCRNLVQAEYEADSDGEYYMAVDVARSQYDSNNKSSITVGRVFRNEKNRVQSVQLVNIFNVSNILNFTSQAVIIKRTKKKYNAKTVVVDGNGIGSGLVDALLMDTIDPETGENLGCWDTINTTNQPQSPDAEQCVYDLKAQSAQSKIITDLIDSVDSGLLRLLETKQYDVVESSNNENYQQERMPYVQTDLLCEEISNLKLETNGKNLMIKKVSNRLDKDRVSSLMYLVYYILEYESESVQNYDIAWEEIFTCRAPRIRA